MPPALSSTFDSELVIGLAGAVGTRLKTVIELLDERLRLAGYSTRVVKVSEEVIKALHDVPDDGGDAYKRISDLMHAGNEVRRETGNHGVLALGVAAKIFDEREKNDNDYPQPLEKTAFIVDSLKRPEEVQYLRQVYASGFVVVGAHEEEARRRSHLEAKGMSSEHADNLIRRDTEEAEVPHGQRLRNTFHLADFFLRIAGNQDRLEADVRRMVELWFGNPFITPTFDEYAMFLAFAAGLRSADLSRQVGAVVTRDRQILSTGANDCPQAGGGLYWPDRLVRAAEIADVPRGRDYMRGEDSNRVEQLRIIDQIAKIGEVEEYGLDGEKLRKLLESTRIGDLTEFAGWSMRRWKRSWRVPAPESLLAAQPFIARPFLVIIVRSTSSPLESTGSFTSNPIRRARHWSFTTIRRSWRPKTGRPARKSTYCSSRSSALAPGGSSTSFPCG